MRTSCVECGSMLQGRAYPRGRWGAWCPRCHGWWPDSDDGRRADTDQPPSWRLTDDPTVVTPVDTS